MTIRIERPTRRTGRDALLIAGTALVLAITMGLSAAQLAAGDHAVPTPLPAPAPLDPTGDR